MATIREALTEAFAASEATTADTPAPEAAAPEAAPPPVEDSHTAESEAPAPVEARPDKPRDEAGKFTRAPKAKPTEAVKPTPVKPTQPATAAPTPAQATPAPEAPKAAEAPLRAPQSWTPAEREAWAKLPPEAQRAVVRQDAEVQKVLRESAPARKFHEAFNQLTTPYAPLLAGTQPLQAISGMLQTVATLATGSAPQKASLVAGLIKSYGVDINHLASALDGQPQPGGQAGGAPVDAQAIYRQVHQQLMADFSRQAQQRQAQAADAEVAKFAASHEFLDDVAGLMASIMDDSARGGVEMTYEEAYNLACKAHPKVAPVVAQREAAAAATAAQAATQRARAASSSVRTQPAAPPNGTEKRSLRSTLEDVASQLSGR